MSCRYKNTYTERLSILPFSTNMTYKSLISIYYASQISSMTERARLRAQYAKEMKENTTSSRYKILLTADLLCCRIGERMEYCQHMLNDDYG